MAQTCTKRGARNRAKVKPCTDNGARDCTNACAKKGQIFDAKGGPTLGPWGPITIILANLRGLLV